MTATPHFTHPVERVSSRARVCGRIISTLETTQCLLLLFYHDCPILDTTDHVSSTNSGATAVPHVSIQLSPTSALQTGPTALISTTESESSGQAPEDDNVPGPENTDPTEASSHKPDFSTTPFNAASNSPELSVSADLTESYTVPYTTEATTTSTSSTPDLTPSLESTTSNPEPDDTENATDTVTDTVTGPDFPTRSATAVPETVSQLDTLATHTPSPTVAVQHDGKDDVTVQVTITGPVEVTSNPSKPKPSETPAKPQEKPDANKPSPTKPALVKPTFKPGLKPLDPVQTLNTNDAGDYQAGKTCHTLS